MPNGYTRQVLSYQLFAISRIVDDKSQAVLSEELMKWFLKFTSKRPETVNCYEHIEYGLADSELVQYPFYGLKIKRKNILLSDILHTVWQSEMALVQERCSEEELSILTADQWRAAIRMAMFVLISFEQARRNPSVAKYQFGVAHAHLSNNLFAHSRLVNEKNLNFLNEEMMDSYWGLVWLLGGYKPIEVDNLMEYGVSRNRRSGGRIEYGLKVTGTNILLSDIMLKVDFKLPLPESIQSKYPSLNAYDWKACLTTTKWVILAFNRFEDELTTDRLDLYQHGP